MAKKGEIRIGIIGVGNCASALIQGIEYYKSLGSRHPDSSIGLMHYNLGGYEPADIKVVSAFDIDKRKAGKTLKEAVFAKPNCTKVFFDKLPDFPVRVSMGHVLDGVSEHMSEYLEENRFIPADKKSVDVAKVLKETGTEIAICYLPVGSEQAVRFYAEECLKAKVAFINCMPVFIASDKKWAKRFEESKVPIIGDDVKSQIGATIVHRVLAKLFEDRGVKITSTYQLNVGGNTDFLNMLNRTRLKSKKVSKTEAVQAQLENPLSWENIHIGPSDFVPFLKDNKICFLKITGKGFGGVPVELELKLSVEDSPNSGGVVIDAIRCAKLALDRKIGGVLKSASAYFMKHPIEQIYDEEAKERVERFIKGELER